jgi:hypothetical protein
MEEVTSAMMMKWTAITITSSLVLGLLGAVIIVAFEGKRPGAVIVGSAMAIIASCGVSIGALAFFISFIWHIIKSFMGG